MAVEGKDHLSFPLFAGKAWERPKLLSNASILLSPHLHFSCHLPSSLTNPTMLLLLSFLNLMLSVRVVSAACYDFNFNLNTHPDAQPCNKIVGRISMCCNTNLSTSDFLTRRQPVSTNDLCKNVVAGSANDITTKYWREGCSDRGWNSQYCLTGIRTSSSVSNPPPK